MSSYNLDSKLQAQEIYLDSQYSTINNTNGKNNDVYFFLNAPVSIQYDHDIVLRIDNFVCPISFFVVNDSNNLLIINSTNYTIAEGNYNALTLTTELNSILSGFTVTYDANNNKLTFSRSTSFTISSSSTCLKIIGFSEISHTSSLSGLDYILTSDYVVNLSGTSLIYIDIPTVTTRNISSKDGGAFTTIIKSIVCDVPYGSILSYTNNTTSAVVLKEKYISYFNVRLLDDEYNLLDLNGQHFTLTLELFFYPNGSQILLGPNLSEAVRKQEFEKQEILKNNRLI